MIRSRSRVTPLPVPRTQLADKSHSLLHMFVLRLIGGATLMDRADAGFCCAAGSLTTEDFFLMQLHAERAQFAAEAVKVVERALEEGRCQLAGEATLAFCSPRRRRRRLTMGPSALRRPPRIGLPFTADLCVCTGSR